MRPLEASARKKGVKFLLNYKMTSIVREPSLDGRAGHVIGITAEYDPHIMPGTRAPLKSFRSEGNIDSTQPKMRLRARKAVIVTTGGSTSHLEFRRMFDPRLTARFRSAASRIATKTPAASWRPWRWARSLWGLATPSSGNGATMRAQRAPGDEIQLHDWELESPIFPLVKSTGFNVKDWQDLILVNQVGRRFYDETKGDSPHGKRLQVRLYTERLSQR